jgi:uncharacterized SAM-binding protein YcdF (DUF218 family)
MSFWFRRFRLIERREIWCPTWFGSFCLALLFVVPAIWWCSHGESFLSLTERLPAEVLVVEGWIGRNGVRAAEVEFTQRAYQYVVPTGGVTGATSWEEPGWSYAEGTGRELIRLGVPKDRIVVAPAKDTETHRTYESAIAVRRALQIKGIEPKAINVFTLGPHARRSRLVFAKVEGPGTKVGVIAWTPSGDAAVPWWRSSARAKQLLSETIGYLFEALLNSGRDFNSRVAVHPLKPFSISRQEQTRQNSMVTGLYFCDEQVVDSAAGLEPFAWRTVGDRR